MDKILFATLIIINVIISPQILSLNTFTTTQSITSFGEIVKEEINLSRLHTEGSFIKNQEGQEIQLVGVNAFSLEWAVLGNNATEENFQSIISWGCNVVRVPFQQQWWEKDYYGYRGTVDKIVTWGEKYGIYIVLDNHWTNLTYKQTEGQPHDWASWILMWENIASRYSSSPVVLYELWNEPAGNIGLTVESWIGNASLCVESIRSIDEDVPIIIDTWAYQNLGWLKTIGPINSQNIIYKTSVYQHNIPDMTSEIKSIETHLNWWSWDWCLENNIPIWVGECSAESSAETKWFANFLYVLNYKGIGYAGWLWNTHLGNPNGFDLIENDWITPTQWNGLILKQAIN